MQNKLELITGIPVPNQEISVQASEDAPESLGVLADDSKPLGYYGIRDWQVLKVRRIYPVNANTEHLTLLRDLHRWTI